MTEKRFTLIDGTKKGTYSGIWDKQKQNNQRIGDELWIGEVVAMLNEGVILAEENEQLKQQIKIFEKFLEGNDLSIDWDEFCGVAECAFENPDFSCKECIHLKGDVE